MRSLRCGSAPRVLLSVTARACVIGAAVVAGGCASQQAANPPPTHVAGPIAPQQTAQAPRVEIEDDGLPSQLAPRHRRPERDDPREPWSPNYGNMPSRRADAGVPSDPMRPAASPIHLSSFDEDDVVRRAIAAHEMRRRD